MNTVNTVVFMDLDRTVTRLGTYTPYLLWAARQRGRSRLGVALGLCRLAPWALGYAAGWVSRASIKARMLKLFLAGVSRTEAETLSNRFAAEWESARLRPGAKAALARHRAAGHKLILATASFDFIAQGFAQMLDLDEVIATLSVWDENNRLIAALGGDNCYGPAKLAAVQKYLSTLTSKPRVIAYSDHHSDLELLRTADEGIAVNPNKHLRSLADGAGLKIEDWG